MKQKKADKMYIRIIALSILLSTFRLSMAYELIWSDEFNGTSLNTDIWDQPEYNRKINDNGPDGWWLREDSYLDGNGHLVIRAKEIPNRNSDSDPLDYSTGAIRTIWSFEQTYGKFEIRCQLPTQPGWWVAFWLLSPTVSHVDGSAEDGVEIDIFEGFGWTDHVDHALHWDGYGDAHQMIITDFTIPGIREGFHTFSVEWYHDVYVFFIDGEETWRTDAGGICRAPAYIKITGELSTKPWFISTEWANDPQTATYPDYFLVDYVRVYALYDTSKSIFYDDYLNQTIRDVSYNSGTLDYYHTDNPKEGEYCIYWADAGLYNAISWQFLNSIDYSSQLNEGYSLNFWMKSNASDLRLDVRFVDTYTGQRGDHPWRMTKTIDNRMLKLDGTWEEVNIPLTEMAEAGSWHNDTWYNPAGLFDWTRIDRLEFVSEHHSLQGYQIYLDEIKIVPFLTLISPNGGEEWLVGSQQTITWESQDIENVKIEYSLDNGDSWDLIAASVEASAKSYDWQIPDSSSESCLIKISNVANDSLYDTSDSKFGIIDL
jgi:beta-glucanase (GH16 family)